MSIIYELSDVCDLIFQRIYEWRGCVMSFFAGRKTCRFVIGGCRPENIVSDIACSVSPEGEDSLFSAVFDVRSVVHTYSEEYFTENNAEFAGRVKDRLLETGIFPSVKEVNSSEIKVSFYSEKETLKKSLSACALLSENAMFHESRVTVRASKNLFFVHIRYARGVKCAVPLCVILSSYSDLFDFYPEGFLRTKNSSQFVESKNLPFSNFPVFSSAYRKKSESLLLLHKGHL